MQVNIKHLIDDVQCYQTVRALRWPDGVQCPSCESHHVIKRGFDDTEPSPRCPSPSTRHARRAKRWRDRGVAPGSAGSLGHALHPLAMRSPGGAALGVRADPRRGHQAAGGTGGTRSVKRLA